MDLTLRDATERDFGALVALHVRSWQDAYRGLVPDMFLDDGLTANRERFWRDKLDQRQPADVILIAEDGQPTAAGLVAVLVGRSAHDRPAFVDNLHVRPGLRGGGLGRRLMAAAVRRVRDRGLDGLSLEVIAGNTRAVDFYRRLGGTVSPVRTVQLYGFDVDEHVVTWDDLDALIAACEGARG